MKINKKCKTCEWAFPEYDEGDRSYNKKNIDYYICAGHSDVVEYGHEIKDLNLTCDCWEIGPDYFGKLSDRLIKKGDVLLVLKYEKELGLDFGLLKHDGTGFKKIKERVFFDFKSVFDYMRVRELRSLKGKDFEVLNGSYINEKENKVLIKLKK